MREVRTMFLDVMGIQITRCSTSTAAPAAATAATRTRRSPDSADYTRNRYVVPEDGVLVGSGDLHPGGLWTDLYVERAERVRVFGSRAKYFEPARAVSWDVSMEATPEDWRVGSAGDVLSVSATYDSRRASWYRRWGSWATAFSRAGRGRTVGDDVDKRGVLTHGHLEENRNHGGAFSGLPIRASCSAPPPPRRTSGSATRLQPRRPAARRQEAGPRPSRGRDTEVVNHDAQRGSCTRSRRARRPATARRDRLPLANGRCGSTRATSASVRRARPRPRTARRGARGNLRAGTYTYFCKIHPFMRGAFR